MKLSFKVLYVEKLNTDLKYDGLPQWLDGIGHFWVVWYAEETLVMSDTIPGIDTHLHN